MRNDPVRPYPRPLTRVRCSLSSPTAPQAAPGQAKKSGAPGKRARKAKATQTGKLRNSAKGKVPKSALGKLGKGPGVLPRRRALCLGGRGLEAGLETFGRHFCGTCCEPCAERSPRNTE